MEALRLEIFSLQWEQSKLRRLVEKSVRNKENQGAQCLPSDSSGVEATEDVKMQKIRTALSEKVMYPLNITDNNRLLIYHLLRSILYCSGG